MGTARRALLIVSLLPAAVIGCGRTPSFSQADLDRGRQALEASLDAWKRGEKPESLRAGPEPIEFAEEWPRAGYRLLDYQVLGTEHTDAETMRYTVALTVQDRRGKREERRVTYAVALASPIAVGRDPFY